MENEKEHIIRYWARMIGLIMVQIFVISIPAFFYYSFCILIQLLARFGSMMRDLYYKNWIKKHRWQNSLLCYICGARLHNPPPRLRGNVQVYVPCCKCKAKGDEYMKNKIDQFIIDLPR